MARLQNVVTELQRRKIFRAAGIYIVAAWVAVQVASLVFPAVNVPDVALRYVWIGAILLFPLVLVFAWFYDLTLSGLARTPPAYSFDGIDLSLRRADYVILIALVVVGFAVTTQLIVSIRDTEPATSLEHSNDGINPNSIAVLPLENLSADPEQQYFVSGMHEALISDLARISGLKVISRTSTEQYRDSNKTAPEIGTDLGVAHLIEGSVLRVGDRVRVTVQLINAVTDDHQWVESYEQDLTDVLRLQSNIARAIADQVKVQLTPYEDISLATSKEVVPEAYEFYLKGRFHWYKFTEADLKLALDYFQLAIDRDPDYALAFVGFADALATPAHIGMMPTTQVFPAATGFVQRALELDPNLAEAHDLQARIHFAFDWDWDAAEREFRRAISLKPGHPDVHIVYSQFLAITNRWEESLEEARIGLELDPLNPWYRLEFAHRLAWFGRYDEAASEIIKLVSSQPDFYPAHSILWLIASEQGRYREAANAAGNYFRLLGESKLAEVLTDDKEDFDYVGLMRIAAELLETESTRPYVSNVDRARLWMHARDFDRALSYLDKAYVQHESHLVYTIVDPQFQPIWRDDRYQNLLRQMNYK